FPHPGATALRARHELAGIELDRRWWPVVRRRFAGVVAFAGKALLGLAQSLAPPLARAQLLGQLVAALVAVELVFAAVDLGRLGEDLACDLAEVAVGVAGRIGRHLRPVDRHHPDRHQPRPRAEAENAGEDLSKRPLVPATELGDRRVIGSQVAGDDAVGDVLDA